jgi:hypothetical protein
MIGVPGYVFDFTTVGHALSRRQQGFKSLWGRQNKHAAISTTWLSQILKTAYPNFILIVLPEMSLGTFPVKGSTQLDKIH